MLAIISNEMWSLSPESKTHQTPNSSHMSAVQRIILNCWSPEKKTAGLPRADPIPGGFGPFGDKNTATQSFPFADIIGELPSLPIPDPLPST